MSSRTSKHLFIALGVALLVAAPTAWAQTRIKPGFNLFSAEQDQEIGRQSAAEVERQLPLLQDAAVDGYVNRVGQRLAAQAPGAKYPYQFKVVNVSDINAFALPGGYLYVNRGLIEAVRSEGELAGVLAHEISHAALRHGTNQTSKAYLGQAGLGILGGLLGRDDAAKQQRIAQVGGLGMNALFLKFSRTDEEQADISGAQMMAKAGYDPNDMVSFFQLLADKRGREPSKVEQFLSDHPAPGDRAARIRQERAMLTTNVTAPVGGLSQVQSRLRRMRPAPTMAQVTNGTSTRTKALVPASSFDDRDRAAAIAIDPPSAGMRTFEHPSQLYRISYPDNWRVYSSDQGYAVTIAPQGGIVDLSSGEQQIVYGMIVNHYDPFGDDADERFGNRRPSTDDMRNQSGSSLSNATDDLVRQIRRTNPSLDLVPGSERRDTIDNGPSLSLVLRGTSPVTRREERVTVFARQLPDDHVLYVLFIAPGEDYEQLKTTFNRMVSSLRVADQAHWSDDPSGNRFSISRSDQQYGNYGSTGASAGSGQGAWVAPAGTLLAVTLDQTLTSAESQPGDTFTARVAEPVVVEGRVTIPVGSVVSGRVVDVVGAKRIGGRAQINLEFTDLRLPSGESGPLHASFHEEGANENKSDAVKIGGGAAAGGVLGRILGKDAKSTVIGAVIGAAVGTGVAARNPGEEVTLREGMTIHLQLDSPFRT